MLPQDKRSRLVREFLADFEKLERPSTDAIGWIMLKLSLSRKQAESAIIDATTPEIE